jgi:hypothetical protein
MHSPNGIIALAIALVIAGTILFVPIGKVDEVETFYTVEPIAYETSVIRENQVSRWIFWDATEIQYSIKNADNIDGVFTLNFIFENGKDTKTSTERISILAGAQEVVTEISPLNGVSQVTLNVIPSSKTIPHTRTVTREVTGWDRIWELRSLFGVKLGR